MQLIKLNDKNPYVQYARLALMRLGYDTDVTNDSFDNALYDQIIRLQTENGLTADGEIGNSTWQLLLPYLKGYTTEVIRPTTTYSMLANKYETTVDAIRTANPSYNENSLQTGQRIVIPFGFSIVPTNVFYTYDLSELLIEGLTARYPFIVSGSTGQSVMGKNISFMTIGVGKTQVFYNASHHANEWITTPVLFKFAEDYSRAYAQNENISDMPASRLYLNKRLSIIPLVNPDGVDLVNNAIPKNSPFYTEAVKIAQRYPNIPFPQGWKANISGTDLNLNYPAGWENAKEIKYSQGFTTPAPRDFVGTSPLSAPESDSVYRHTLKNSFNLTLSYHTQGEVIYWKYLDYNPPRSLEIGEALSEASGYTLEITPSQSGYAGYKDWFIYFFNRPGYTVEAGMGENPLPITQFDEIYSDNLPLLTVALDLA